MTRLARLDVSGGSRFARVCSANNLAEVAVFWLFGLYLLHRNRSFSILTILLIALIDPWIVTKVLHPRLSRRVPPREAGHSGFVCA